MQLNYDVFCKLNTLTKAEMNMYLCLVTVQSETGRVHGITHHYLRDKGAFSSKQTFYNCLRSLREKGFIRVSRYEGAYDIDLIGNTGYSKGNKDYINLNRRFFRTKAFFTMPAALKYMLIELMRSTSINKGKRIIGKTSFYEKLCKLLSLSLRSVQRYVHVLRRFFSIILRGKNYCIMYAGRNDIAVDDIATYPDASYKSGTDRWREYIGSMLISSKHLCYTQKDSLDLGQLFWQYRNYLDKYRDPVNIFRLIMDEYMTRSMEKQFQIKLFHKLLRQGLALE